MEIKMRSLGEVIDVVKGMGLDVTHAYDDLAFVTNNPFIVQIPDVNGIKVVKLFFNKDCDDEAIPAILTEFATLAKERGFATENAGRFEMTQKEDEKIELKFY